VRESFGRTPDGREVERVVLRSDVVEVAVLSFGATVQSVLVPDAQGRVDDVVLGFDELDGYLGPHPYLGSVIGRYANRIADGRFPLDGEQHQVPVNNGPNALHGGTEGFDHRLWDVAEATEESVTLRLVSPHGDMGFPGRLEAEVSYRLSGGDLRLDYRATTDRPTVVNLTNHTYWNLAGGGTVEGHEVQVEASGFTPVDADLIPTGDVARVDGTPFDFRSPRLLGDRLRDADEQLLRAQGYDHNLVLDGEAGTLRPVARVRDPGSGRTLEVSTDQPGLQLYSGNFLDGTLVGKRGRTYRQGDAFCLETQHFPDSPNRPEFPSTVLQPGEVYATTTVFRLGVA
jgi:aldose 1-epimerase